MAQNENEKKGRPNIPGSVVFDWGVNLLTTHKHDTLKTKWGLSNTVNVYYMYEMNVTKNGQITFNPGIGVGVDKIGFSIDRGLASIVDSTTYERNTVMLPIEDMFPNAVGVKKTKLGITYLDIPMELRYHTNPNDRDRSFKIAVGGRIGFLLNQKTKYKFTEVDAQYGNQEDVKVKYHQDFGVSKFRFGTTFRMGVGPFNVFYYHNFSPLFRGDRGPEGTKVSNYTVGLTISGF